MRNFWLAGLAVLCGVMAAEAASWTILRPVAGPPAYAVAAREFQKYHEAVTGVRLDIVTEPAAGTDLVVIGSDTVNRFCRTAVEEGVIAPLRVGADTDFYQIRSAARDGRRYLFLAGGNGRATLYAVYDFFERQAGCRWFWDEDVVPRRPVIEMTGLDVFESPRFAYRGIRYFAHRSLDRFQAEHWGPEQWEREIDWILKKRLNLFMLRIGMDDVWQKAFPEAVPYPPTDAPLPEAVARSYDDRTSAWPLQYRGELRKHILRYARDRGLMHPEDTGTMTHWYSRTPNAFLEKAKPAFIPQSGGSYQGNPTSAIWDIRDDTNIENYWKLTSAHIEQYGSPELFHTIGLAERQVFANRKDNLEIKLYAYRRIIGKVREHYPQAPVLIASWDFYYPGWSGDEVSALLRQLNPENTLILDYTSDLPQWPHSSNFTQWGVVGKFPWTFGIFHAYESENDLRGNYDLLRDRLPIAAADPLCKGFIYWPETSHSDSLILEYFTRNAWRPETLTPEEMLPSFCRDRYPSAAEPMLAAWRAALPVITLHNELSSDFRHLERTARQEVTPQRADALRGVCAKTRTAMTGLPAVFDSLRDLPFGAGDTRVDRDAIDLARTVAGRVFTVALYRYIIAQSDWQHGRADAAGDVTAAGDRCASLLETLRDLLALHDDYSMQVSMAKLSKTHPVNPCFEQALKGNAENGYCRSYIYELFNDYYLPQLACYTRWVSERVAGGDRSRPMRPDTPLPMQAVTDGFYAKPLADMAPRVGRSPEAYRAAIARLARQAAGLMQ